MIATVLHGRKESTWLYCWCSLLICCDCWLRSYNGCHNKRGCSGLSFFPTPLYSKQKYATYIKQMQWNQSASRLTKNNTVKFLIHLIQLVCVGQITWILVSPIFSPVHPVFKQNSVGKILDNDLWLLQQLKQWNWNLWWQLQRYGGWDKEISSFLRWTKPCERVYSNTQPPDINTLLSHSKHHYSPAELSRPKLYKCNYQMSLQTSNSIQTYWSSSSSSSWFRANHIKSFKRFLQFSILKKWGFDCYPWFLMPSKFSRCRQASPKVRRTFRKAM